MLATADAPRRCVILKREGPVGHFVYLAKTDGSACFPMSDLPDVVRRLFNHTAEENKIPSKIEKTGE